jgi:Cdc6-like AAA superfamily ATPase
MSASPRSPHRLITIKLRGFFGHFPQVQITHRRLKQVIEDSQEGVEPECVAIIGDTGTGKSTLLERLADKYPRVEHAEFTEVPVLYVKIPPRCTVKMLAGVLLKKLGSKFWDRGDEVDRTHQLVTLLKACRVRLIILDEANHLADRGASKSHYFVGDWIKQLIDVAKVPVVLAGTPTAAILWQTNEQLGDRFREVMTLEPLSMSRPEELRSVLRTFAGLMDGIEVADFVGTPMARAMVFATAGRLRAIRKLLVRSVKFAEDEALPRIDKTTLERAFAAAIYPKTTDDRNPFSSKFNGLPLIGKGEPFAPRGFDK